MNLDVKADVKELIDMFPNAVDIRLAGVSPILAKRQKAKAELEQRRLELQNNVDKYKEDVFDTYKRLTEEKQKTKLDPYNEDVLDTLHNKYFGDIEKRKAESETQRIKRKAELIQRQIEREKKRIELNAENKKRKAESEQRRLDCENNRKERETKRELLNYINKAIDKLRTDLTQFIKEGDYK
jgi:hypothetical protein